MEVVEPRTSLGLLHGPPTDVRFCRLPTALMVRLRAGFGLLSASNAVCIELESAMQSAEGEVYSHVLR